MRVNLLHELYQQLEQLRHMNQRAALATLVNTLGTSPRKEGEKMWVGERGAILGSVTIGGCVDASVIEHAEAALAEQRPRLIELALGDEEAWELGLSCAGRIEVFIEPFQTEHAPWLDLYRALKSHVEEGGAGVLMTCLSGPTIGAKRLLLDDGVTLGSLGDLELEEAICREARSAFTQGVSRTLSLTQDHKMVRVFIEVHAPPVTLIIVGANHIAILLVQMARSLGFQTIVVDSRPRFATPERFPDTDALLVGIPSEIVKTVPLSASNAVILVAHDYKYDLPILRHILSSPVGYIGVLGSRQRGEGLKKFLREEGVSQETLQRIHVPIGLDLGGRAAPEIALAILAEVVSVRYGGTSLPLRQLKQTTR
jgi:xanthine dehydrogenase accessory factor